MTARSLKVFSHLDPVDPRLLVPLRFVCWGVKSLCRMIFLLTTRPVTVCNPERREQQRRDVTSVSWRSEDKWSRFSRLISDVSCLLTWISSRTTKTTSHQLHLKTHLHLNLSFRWRWCFYWHHSEEQETPASCLNVLKLLSRSWSFPSLSHDLISASCLQLCRYLVINKY